MVSREKGAVQLVCAGCGAVREMRGVAPYRCPNEGRDGGDHVVRRELDLAKVAFERGDDPNPFVRYREMLFAWHLGRALGKSDDEYVANVRWLNDVVGDADGAVFRETPLIESPQLCDAIGLPEGVKLFVKDETGNVAGSHKGRHLMGLGLSLAVAERAGLPWAKKVDGEWPYAIASCGNAALAAAVVARALKRPLDVFIPPTANPVVVRRLEELGARITLCERKPGVAGDPCVLRFREAVARGAVPFCCQGNENGLAIDGGMTLAFEMISALRARGATLDHLFVQVGGGALASACAQAFQEAGKLGVIEKAPRLFAVQTAGGYPLARAHKQFMARLLDDSARAGTLRFSKNLRYAASHRAEFMWPWESEPKSVAHGILDDETYDWLAVLEAMVRTGGSPVVVDEETLERANLIAKEATGIPVDPTGSAGLAGLIERGRSLPIAPGENVAVIFSGVERR